MSSTERARVFEGERAGLFGLAYRMLGTIADAEDIVQETWIRWSGADDVERPGAWLTTVASRLALDRLRSAQHRRECYVGTWLPEPIVSSVDDPAAIVELNESLTLGFLTMLDRLDPVDRAVFLLRDVFDMPYGDVATALDRTEANCRQIAKRARERVRSDRTPRAVDPARREELLDTFLSAVLSGSPEQLAPLLTADALHLSDGGATVRAARRPVVGRDRVARFLANLATRVSPEAVGIERVDLNGQPGWLVRLLDEPYLLLEVEFDGDLVHRVHAVSNPDKVAAALARVLPPPA